MPSITLVLPGLLPVPPVVTDNDLPGCRTLARLLTRADRAQCSPDYYRQLFDCFGMQPDEGQDYPVAPVGYLAETGCQPQYCLRADPVHLSASRDGMALMDNAMIGLQPHEAEALAAELQPLFSEFQAELVTPHAAHWYINSAEPPAICTTPLPDVIARDVSTALPVGDDQTRWRQLFNEIQMVLHTCEVNEARSRRGQLPVNSLWFWGGGTLPARGAAAFDYCFSDDPFVRGLGLLHEQSVDILPESIDTLLGQAEQAQHILVTDATARRLKSYDDVPKWLGLLEQLEQNWFLPLEAAQKRGRLQQINIVIDGTRYAYRRRHQWRFWRRGSLMNLSPD